MIYDFQQNSAYGVRRLNPETDWEIFRDHLSRTYGENNYSWVLETQDFNDPEMWQREMQRSFQFGLFFGDDLVGSTELYYTKEGDVVFTGSVIEQAHRGKLLADNLYDARKSFLREAGFDGTIRMEILDTNERSLNAADRNGFIAKDEIILDWAEAPKRYVVLEYVCY